MFSTIDRYLMRQILLAWGAITAVLFLILLSVMLGRILQEVARGLLAPGLLGTVVALKSIGALNLMMPFSLFMACMLVLGRMYRDSEIVVLWACGGAGCLAEVGPTKQIFENPRDPITKAYVGGYRG